ncbi:MAG: MarR family transcriptional regulator [Proteobacteria bacterium]|nr:MarR family transcriptional regulator [Pseudomonadota bacterium]
MTKKTKDVRLNSLGFLLNTLVSQIESRMIRELEKLGLTLKQFGTLMMLFELEGASQVMISKSVGIPGYATTRILDELEQKKLVYRHRPPENRRTHHIFLTDEGKKLRSILPPLVMKVNRVFLSSLSDKEAMIFIELLKKMVK